MELPPWTLGGNTLEQICLSTWIFKRLKSKTNQNFKRLLIVRLRPQEPCCLQSMGKMIRIHPLCKHQSLQLLTSWMNWTRCHSPSLKKQEYWSSDWWATRLKINYIIKRRKAVLYSNGDCSRSILHSRIMTFRVQAETILTRFRDQKQSWIRIIRPIITFLHPICLRMTQIWCNTSLQPTHLGR